MNQHPQRPDSYKGRAGSTADLAMGHLELHGPTGEIALASAIDKEVHELGALLSWPIKQGALKKQVVGDEWVYSMGDGVPLAAAPPPPAPAPGITLPPRPFLEAAVAGADKAVKLAVKKAIEKAASRAPAEHTQRGLTAMQARGEVMELEACASATSRGGDAAPARAAGPNASPVGGPMGARQPAAAGPLSDDFRVALWSDGVLDIRRPGGHLVRFTKDEARKLVTYLEQISLDPLREEATA